METVKKKVTPKLYYKIKVEFLFAKKRFYRVFLVRTKVTVLDFIEAIRLSIRASDDHLYELGANECYGEGKYVDDLPKKSMFIYDFGDNYRFVVTKYKRTAMVESNKRFLLLDAKGQGIWEDFIRYFYAYLSGEYTDEDCNPEVDDPCPIPYDYLKPSDFDEPVDLQELEDTINKYAKG